ncbi:MAG: hypothetical protein ABUL72_05940 [Armatimonadota bacterium]
MPRSFADLDGVMWQLVRRLYYEDKVEEALFEASKLGGHDGSGRDNNYLYAEAETRREGTPLKLRPWLTLEVIESEISEHLQPIGEILGSECEALSRQFRWDNSEATWVTILPKGVEAPWMPGRWGYFIDKVPYDKICLPYHLVLDLPELRRTIRHEFMHDITLNLSQGRASLWVEEAFSTYAEDRFVPGHWVGFQKGALDWLNPNELNTMLSNDHRQPHLHASISTAYSQANFIARYLDAKFSSLTFGDFLTTLGHKTLLETVGEGLFSRSPVDTALHKVYHRSEGQVFAEALEWVKATRLSSGA